VRGKELGHDGPLQVRRTQRTTLADGCRVVGIGVIPSWLVERQAMHPAG
jgi:hypothetical protein